MICQRCGFEIHPADAREYRGTGATHDAERCVYLLRDRIAEIEAENERLRADVTTLIKVSMNVATENARLRANWPKHHGCACKFDDDDDLVSRCASHKEREEGIRVAALEEAANLAEWGKNHLDIAAAIRALKDKP